jgi:hypothetical protein
MLSSSVYHPTRTTSTTVFMVGGGQSVALSCYGLTAAPSPAGRGLAKPSGSGNWLVGGLAKRRRVPLSSLLLTPVAIWASMAAASSVRRQPKGVKQKLSLRDMRGLGHARSWRGVARTPQGAVGEPPPVMTLALVLNPRYSAHIRVKALTPCMTRNLESPRDPRAMRRLSSDGNSVSDRLCIRRVCLIARRRCYVVRQCQEALRRRELCSDQLF